MKKALFATTALVLSAGFASADVTISGYGRTGVQYVEDRERDGVDLNETQVVSRMRLNIDASTSTDQGVDFGGRIRLQWDQGNSTRGDQAETNAAKLWVKSNGLTVEIGNVDNAYDSSTLLFGPELGAFDTNRGAANGDYFAYVTGPYSDVDRQGVGVVYSIDAFKLRASYIDPDQSGLYEDGIGQEEEMSVLLEYSWNDRLELEAAYTTDGAGIKGNDIAFIGARYAVMDNARIGLNYVDISSDTDDDQSTVTLYGDYTLADGLTNIEAFIANNDNDDNANDNAYGIGVNYDLGGARLGASIQQDYDEVTYADFGVRFDF